MKRSRSFAAVKRAFLRALKKAAKDLNLNPQDVDSTEFWAVASPKSISEWEVRKYGGFTKIKSLVAPYQVSESDRHGIMNSLELTREKIHKRIEIQKSLMLEDIRAFSDQVFTGRIKPIASSNKSRAKTKRVLNAVLSDIHIGADVKLKETGVLNYGPVEEARRLAAVVKQIVEYKPQYRDETELELLLLGDIIQNSLHDPRDGAPLAEQVCRAIHLLGQAIAHLAANFKRIRVRCNTGNHGRNKGRHLDRATNQKWDSIETILYYALKSACSPLKNVEFDIPLTPYGIYENFGNKILYTHGDTVLNPGYPGRAINVKKLEEQINKINASLPDKDEIKVVIVGHVHTGSVTYLSNGAVMITNGALIPVDEYAVSLGMLESAAGQFIFESVEGFPVGDVRYICVNGDNDQDVALDKIIRPWSSM
jgi:predicted phosphodiesterase